MILIRHVAVFKACPKVSYKRVLGCCICSHKVKLVCIWRLGTHTDRPDNQQENKVKEIK